MIKKIWLFSFVLFISISVIATSANAFFGSDVKKAKEFMEAGMFPQAIDLLNKRVSEKPTDAEAHYELGVCYINTGNFRGADKRFGSAVRLKPDYGYKIGGEYQKAGNESLKKGSVNSAINLFRKAVKFQPDLKETIAQECFDAGMSCLDKNQSKNADRLFSMALEYNPALKDEKVKVTHEYGKKLLAIAKEKPKSKRRKYVNEAKKYVTQKEVDAVLPPPTLQVTYKKEFIGTGLGYHDYVKTVEFGKNKDFVNGDIVTIMGNHFSVNTSKGWEGPENGKRDIKIEKYGPGYLLVKNPKGKKFTVIVKKYIGSY